MLVQELRTTNHAILPTTRKTYCGFSSSCHNNKLRGIANAPPVPPEFSAISVDSFELGTDAAIEKYLSGRDLDPIEGAWVHDKNAYEFVITKNNFDIERDYQYVAIITRAERGSWKPGEIKLLLRETASDSLFTGVWFMEGKSRRNLSFTVKDPNLIKANFKSTDGDTYLIRTSPKDGGSSVTSDPSSSGTGFFVSKDGLILTSNHIVKDATDIFVTTHSGDRLKAVIVSHSKAMDAALLKIPYTPESFLELASTKNISIGDAVYTIGYPSTEILGHEAKYSEGVVNALSGAQGDATFFQISAPVQPGNSGGPLINRNGRVIGIITATAAIPAFVKNTGTLPQNVNWAVKSDFAPALSQKLQLSKTTDEIEDPIQHAKISSVFVEVTR